MANRLAGEIAIVTGAGRGIGAATALALARAGASVAVTARRVDEAAAVAGRIASAHGRAIAVACDVGEATSVDDAVKQTERRLGTPTILINNAGRIAPIGKFAEVAVEEWAAVIDVNLIGAVRMAHAVLPAMLAAGRGTIVNVSSGAARRAMVGWSAYCASKAGLNMLTQSLALEHGGAGLRVFSLAPGIVDTDMQGAIRESGIGPIARLPRAMLASPEDPATAIAFLCSPEGQPFAGEILDIRDGKFRAAAGLPPLPV
jgi:NAD(P)-dependent dehydrogenase (short-subunit alcohol dehydrogenase family)